jgi:hypothetical protein
VNGDTPFHICAIEGNIEAFITMYKWYIRNVKLDEDV